MFDRQTILDQLTQAGVDPNLLGQLTQSLPEQVGPEHLQQFGIDPTNLAGNLGNLAGSVPGLGDAVNNLPDGLAGLVPGLDQPEQAPADQAQAQNLGDQVQGFADGLGGSNPFA